MYKIKNFSFPNLGVSTTEGDPWEAQRNFLHSHLLNLVKGKGSQGFHDIIMDEVSDLKMELSKKVDIRSLKIHTCFCKQKETGFTFSQNSESTLRVI